LEVAAGGNPSGLETVAPCEAVEAAAGSGAVVGGGVTMAETTLDVTFGAPAELVVGAAGVEGDVAEPAAVELGGGTMAEAVAPATTAEPALFPAVRPEAATAGALVPAAP